MKRASQIETKPVEFVIDGIPVGMFTVVSGRPGEGKSTWAIELAARVSQTANVIASMHEDHHEATVKPRLEGAGAVLRRVFIPEEPFLFPRDVELLERRIKQMNAKLVVCDSAAQHFNVTMSSGQQVRMACTPLKAMLERTGCALVFIDHLVKRPKATAHPLEALSGAGSGLPAAARFVYVFGRNPKDPAERILAPVKVNAIRADRSYAYEMQDAAVFTRDGKAIEVGRLVLVNDESDVDASQVIAFNGGGKANDEAAGGIRGAIAQEWLIGFLMFGPRLANDVGDEGKEAGFSWRTLQRSAEKIGIKRNRVNPTTMQPQAGKGSAVMWSLPDGHPALAVAAQMNGQTTMPVAVS